MSISKERLAEIEALNRINPPGPFRLRADANDAQLEEARAAAFECKVDQEAYRAASHNGIIVPTEFLVNRLKPSIRAKMRAAQSDGGGLFAPLKRVMDKLSAHEEKGIELMHEREEAESVQLQAESMQARRDELVKSIARAEGHLTEAKAHVARMTVEIDRLFLQALDHDGGSVYTGLIECYMGRATAELILADAPRLRKVWADSLAAFDKDFAAFKRQQGL